ncbi:mitochondrial 54S ribosomal protein mL57 [Lipomyces oligophaga]|uniref:mitochondrial 54S ribosomal protein mL57 n=1 Tax=Lipomyces oligophaga TaxID=45792 RepID=UPI0034CF9E4C
MNRIRAVVRPLSSSSSGLFQQRIYQPLARRTVVYLDGFENPGKLTVKSDAPDYVQRETLLNDSVEEAWKRLIGEHNQKFALPKELLTQVFTHKSYRHGILPYNDRLAYFGKTFFTAQVCMIGSSYPSNEPGSVAGRDVNALLSTTVQSLIKSRLAAFSVAKDADLLQIMLWQPSFINDPEKMSSPRATGLYEVGSHVLYASIGAVALHLGAAVAEQFVDNVILGGPHGIMTLTNNGRLLRYKDVQ